MQNNALSFLVGLFGAIILPHLAIAGSADIYFQNNTKFDFELKIARHSEKVRPLNKQVIEAGIKSTKFINLKHDAVLYLRPLKQDGEQRPKLKSVRLEVSPKKISSKEMVKVSKNKKTVSTNNDLKKNELKFSVGEEKYVLVRNIRSRTAHGNKMKFTINHVNRYHELETANHKDSAQRISVMSHNLFQVTGKKHGKYGFKNRAKDIYHIYKTIKPDVIVFEEAFSKDTLAKILDSLKPFGYIHVSEVQGARSKLFNGGVLIVSRHPFLEPSDFKPFSLSPSLEAVTRRGVSHARILKTVCKQAAQECEEQAYDIFASHTHWTISSKLRGSQFKLIRKFIEEKNNDPKIPIILAGDLNTFKERQGQNRGAYLRMLNILQANIGDEDSFYQGYPHSVDFFSQKLNSSLQGRLDYVLPLEGAKLPIHAFNQVIMAKSPSGGPLSDHYPVFAEFIYRN